MSSTAFGVVLPVNHCGRQVVGCSGAVLTLCGVLLIVCLPFDGAWRLLLLVIWLADCMRSLRRLAAAWPRVMAIRLDNHGTVGIDGPAGDRVTTTLASGSVVCRRFAWLRFRLPGGGSHAELLLAAHSGAVEWHRFQLIWRLCQKSFGHPGRA